MRTLDTVRDELLTTATPEKVLYLTDEYLQQIEKMGPDFRLPKDRVALKPLLEEFAGDLAGWLQFVRDLRDKLESRSPQRTAVQELARTLDVRLTQQQRRVRLGAVVARAIEKGMIKDEYTAKMAYADRCTKAWILRRRNLLESHRQGTEHKRLNSDVRADLLAEMWANIDAEIANGEVPKP